MSEPAPLLKPSTCVDVDEEVVRMFYEEAVPKMIVGGEDVEDSPAWERAVMEILEQEGQVVQTGTFTTDSDGKPFPVYQWVCKESEIERYYRSAATQHTLNILEREGKIMRDGTYRRARDGRLQPVYVSTRKPTTT